MSTVLYSVYTLARERTHGPISDPHYCGGMKKKTFVVRLVARLVEGSRGAWNQLYI